jgi:ABC-2 type transport system ATP-binding protein
MSVEICNLSKKYKRHQALSSVSFTVNDHEIAAFLGPNGAGKSTTLKIIGGFLTPDSGRVRINGADFLKN